MLAACKCAVAEVCSKFVGSVDEQSIEHVWVVLQPTSGFVGTQPMLEPMIGSGAVVGTQPMLTPSSGAFAGTQAMLVPMAAPAPLPPVLPTLRGSAAEVELLANVELAEQRLWEFNIMYDEQRKKLLNDEQGAVDTYRRVVGNLPIRPDGPSTQGTH